MSTAEQIVLLAGMFAVTFVSRYPLLALSEKVTLPDWLKAALEFVPVAVLSALCVPILFMPEGQLWISINNEHLVAGIFTIAVAAISRHLMLTIISGMTVFLVLRLFF